MAKRKSSSISGKTSSNPSVNLLKNTNEVSKGHSLNASSSNDLTRSSIGTELRARPLQFGSPSHRAGQGSSSHGSVGSWAGLLGNISGDGLGSLLGGGAISSGLEYLASGIESLFGGGPTASNEPLTMFEMPDSLTQTIFGDAVQPGAKNAPTTGIYNTPQSTNSRVSRASIVQTIKNALLTSSSLNDVIGEL